MRITEEEKAENRRRIVQTAGRLFRERGLANVGIAELMHEAGFTHGGFYNHFESKEALAAEVCASGLARGNRTFAEALEGADPDAAWRTFVAGYLSPGHRDEASTGCSVAGLIGDAAHEGFDLQAAMAAGVNEMVELVSGYFARRYRLDEAAARRRAIEAWTHMVGAVSLSRATVEADRELADEVLAVCRERLAR